MCKHLGVSKREKIHLRAAEARGAVEHRRALALRVERGAELGNPPIRLGETRR